MLSKFEIFIQKAESLLEHVDDNDQELSNALQNVLNITQVRLEDLRNNTEERDDDALDELKVSELRALCKRNGWRGYSKMNKTDIIEFIVNNRQDAAPTNDYQTMKVSELRNICRERELKGYSKMRKDDIINMILQNERGGDNIVFEDQSGDEQSDGEQSGSDQSGDDQSDGEQSGDEQSGDEQSDGEQSGSDQSGDEQSGDEQSDGEQSGSDQSGDDQSDGEQSGDEQSDDDEEPSDNDEKWIGCVEGFPGYITYRQFKSFTIGALRNVASKLGHEYCMTYSKPELRQLVWDTLPDDE